MTPALEEAKAHVERVRHLEATLARARQERNAALAAVLDSGMTAKDLSARIGVPMSMLWRLR